MTFVAGFDRFHESATQATRCTDFGTPDYVPALKIMLEAYDTVRFTMLGRQMIEAEIIGKLIGRLLSRQGLKANPRALDTPIRAPLVLFGTPRTGSTALHRLIALDPDMQSLPMWLGATPMPRPPRNQWATSPWFQGTAAALEAGYARDPGIRSLHPIEAAEPDECRFALDHSFWSPDCTPTAPIPDYTSWLLACDARYAFRYHREVLALVANGDARRWVLKDPGHLFALGDLIAEFPDGHYVQTHRDPLVALTSVASLIFRLRRLREDDPCPRAHGDLILQSFGEAMRKAERDRQALPTVRILDIHNDDLHHDPVATLERIYAHCGLAVTDAARTAWRTKIATDPRGGHGDHDYSPDDFGFSQARLDAFLGDCIQRYEQVERCCR